MRDLSLMARRMDCPDPPDGVGSEAAAPLRIEALGRLHEADVSLTDEVFKGKASRMEIHCDLHHESQVRLDKLLFGALAPVPGKGGVVVFFGSGQQWDFFQLPEIDRETIVVSRSGRSGVGPRPVSARGCRRISDRARDRSTRGRGVSRALPALPDAAMDLLVRVLGHERASVEGSALHMLKIGAKLPAAYHRIRERAVESVLTALTKNST